MARRSGGTNLFRPNRPSRSCRSAVTNHEYSDHGTVCRRFTFCNEQPKQHSTNLSAGEPDRCQLYSTSSIPNERIHTNNLQAGNVRIESSLRSPDKLRSQPLRTIKSIDIPSTLSYRMSGGQPSPDPNWSYILTSNQSVTTNSTSYYLSSGPSELDVRATFVPLNAAFTPSSTESASSFIGWIGNFGQAFPLWVKLLYLALAIQFFAVGGLWIRRESSRKESTGQYLDAGNKVFLWMDVTCKFLLTAFLAIIVIMGGELLVLFILRFMFLVSLDLLSLWDLFVVGFAAGILVMAYLIRFTLEKGFDLKPLEEE